MSSLIGASLCEPNKNYYCVLGDLAFFYDMNVLGNRHVGRNVRILVVNNGKGTEFKLYNHHAAYFGEQSEEYISAAGHFGNKSSILIRQYVEALGFEYITASNKNEFTKRYPKFLSNDVQSKPMVFEVFTESEEESQALELMLNIKQDKKKVMKSKAKNLLGEKGLTFTKRILRR
jgi:2-succinyl-5-enolpyruvyl-6-hydroxy-3-cyclohexene-1-carboxylate synthase